MRNNANILLWVRTKRKVETYGYDDFERLERRLGQPDQFTSIQVSEPFVGDDCLIYRMDYPDGLRSLKALITPAMTEEMVSDWSLTKIGCAFSGPIDWDDVATDAYGDEYLMGSYEEIFQEADAAMMSWSGIDENTDSMVLWLDLERERQEPRDPDFDRVERALPGQVLRLWHGRSSMAFGFTLMPVNMRQDGAFQAQVLKIVKALALPVSSSWLLFQVGNESLGGVAENMNPMDKFIWRKRGNMRRTGKHKRNAGET